MARSTKTTKAGGHADGAPVPGSPDPEPAAPAFVDPRAYPSRPIDTGWAAESLTNAIDLLRRYHQAIRHNDETIATDDEMWNGLGKDQPEYARLHYMFGGRSALKSIIDTLLIADAPPPPAILDFPSGHGRVTRFLRAAFPESEIWAGDVNRAGVDFCRRHFGALPLYSRLDLTELVVPRQFDLIWCGSLASHLPEPQCRVLFALLTGCLAPDGILCITTCGRGMQWAHENSFRTIHDEGYAHIQGQLAAGSFGFSPYSYRYGPYAEQENYGMAFVYPEWIQKNVLSDTLQLLHLEEKGWHGAQDVWCLRKRPISAWYDWARSR